MGLCHSDSGRMSHFVVVTFRITVTKYLIKALEGRKDLLSTHSSERYQTIEARKPWQMA